MQIAIDPKSNAVTRDGKVARLSPTSFRLVSLLWEARPHGLHCSTLRNQLWAHRRDGGPLHYSNLSVHISYANDRLERLGIVIRQGYGTKSRVRLLVM